MLIPEFDREMAKTRRTLERIPEDNLSWKPHRKSWSMIELASHLANLLTWTRMALKEDSFNLSSPSGTRQKRRPASSREALLKIFDKNCSDARSLIQESNDDHLLEPWTLLLRGEEVFTQPRLTVIRSFVLNHTIHHRAQLGVYLRLNDIPVPGPYGPSADEV